MIKKLPVNSELGMRSSMPLFFTPPKLMSQNANKIPSEPDSTAAII